MKLILFGLTMVLIIVSCKKNSKNHLQVRLDSGESIEILLTDFPLDSFYGKFYQAGFIFHINEDGSGIIAALNDHPNLVSWGCPGVTIEGADAASIGSGMTNSSSIISQCDDEFGGASICNKHVSSGYSDWYLPSEDELKKMYTKLRKVGIGNLTNEYYWSSTEGESFNTGQRILFQDGTNGASTKSNAHRVRAVRNF